MSKRDEIQQQALDIALKYKRCGLGISMGVGKTLIGLKYLSYLQEQNMNKLNVLVVAPKLSIFDTWKDDAVKFDADEKVMDQITYTTYLSLNKFNPHSYDIVVLDECHSLLDSHEPFLASYQGRILGLTGTPPRYPNTEKGLKSLLCCSSSLFSCSSAFILVILFRKVRASASASLGDL